MEAAAPDRPETAAQHPAPVAPTVGAAERAVPGDAALPPPTAAVQPVKPAITTAGPAVVIAPSPDRPPVGAPLAPAIAPNVVMRDNEDARPTCTVAQLRRFIKSRPWIPMHELRRRFGIAGGDDDVSPIRVGDHTLFVGLPAVESRLMAELLGGGDVGYELSLDPVTPIVVGVYPMRPVPRG